MNGKDSTHIASFSPSVFQEPEPLDLVLPSEIEQRIYEFLDSKQVFYKSPIDKMYDYFDRKREEVVRSASMLSLCSNEEKNINRKKVSSCEEGQWGNEDEEKSNNGVSHQTLMKNRTIKLHLSLNLRKNHSEI